MNESPILFLKEKILKYFNYANPQFKDDIEKLISKKIADGTINYNLDRTSFKSPKVNSDGKITIPEIFLEYLWIHCYYVYMIYENLAVPHFENVQQNKGNIINWDLLDEISTFHDYGMSLYRGGVAWDTNTFPYPAQENEKENIHILYVNQLFLHAISSVICHEFAHLDLGHFNSIGETKVKEKEADIKSFEIKLKGCDGKNDMNIKLGTLLGLTSLLLLSPQNEFKTHPAPLERIKYYMEFINPDSTNPLWSLICMVINSWDSRFHKDIQFPNEVADHKEMFYRLYNEIAIG